MVLLKSPVDHKAFPVSHQLHLTEVGFKIEVNYCQIKSFSVHENAFSTCRYCHIHGSASADHGNGESTSSPQASDVLFAENLQLLTDAASGAKDPIASDKQNGVWARATPRVGSTALPAKALEKSSYGKIRRGLGTPINTPMLGMMPKFSVLKHFRFRIMKIVVFNLK